MADKAAAMIMFVLVCVAFLLALAIVVPIVDAFGTSSSRVLAAERRERARTRVMAALRRA